MCSWPKPITPTLEDSLRKVVRREPILCVKGYRALVTRYDKGEPTVACKNPRALLMECHECLHGTLTDHLSPFEEKEFWGSP